MIYGKLEKCQMGCNSYMALLVQGFLYTQISCHPSISGCEKYLQEAIWAIWSKKWDAISIKYFFSIL